MSIKKGSVTIASSVPTTEWGGIEGTLSDQTDLQNALNAKAPTLSPTLTGVPTAPTATDGTNTNQIATTKYVRTAITNAISEAGTLPEQTGQSGKYLTTDGTNASWATVDALPSQTGQAGKVLTTNGTTASWTAYSATPSVDGDTIHLNSSDELEVIGTIEKNAGDVKYDWIGTYAEWEAGRENETIPDDWICYITDDFVPSTVTHNIGDIFYSLRTDTMFNGAVACDGTQYDIANYSEGTQSLKSLLDAGKLPYISITDFDATVTTNGSCRCFGYDGSSATVFKVPKLNDVFIEAGIAANNSEFIEAGLPNITGDTFGGGGSGGSSGTGYGIFRNDTSLNTGAFYLEGIYKNAPQTSSSGWAGTDYNARGHLKLDASRSSSIYGNSDTVQPNAVKYKAYIQLANATSESALQTVSTVVNDVNDLKNEIKETLQYKNITNCITEIPQDIKFELNNGTLTLKSGSKVYIPNGFEQDGTTQKFDVVTIENDISFGAGTISDTTERFVYYRNGGLEFYAQSQSGTITPSSSNWIIFYNTSDNTIKRYQNDVTDFDEYSLPIGIVKADGTYIVGSIEQVFNGIGYIGSTVFALPGVKGLIPNGRNEDGTLNNKEYTVSNVLTRTAWSVDYNAYSEITITQTGEIGINTHHLNEPENYLYNIAGAIHKDRFVAGTISFSNVSPFKITSFSPKTTFHALDYNDKPLISSWSMPSEKYVDLTSTSGSIFTAPSNGYVVFKNNNTGTANVQAYIENQTKNMISTVSSYYNNGGGFLPVSKGDKVYLYINSGVSVVYYRFIYAQGEI